MKHMNMRSLMEIGLILLILLITTGICRSANHALLIGVHDYPGVPPAQRLEGPPNDVAALKNILQKYGFQKRNIETLVREKATKRAIMTQLNALKKKTKPGDTVFLFFSGHGSSPFDEDFKEDTNVPEHQKSDWGMGTLFTGGLLPYDIDEKDPLNTIIIGRRDLRKILLELDQGNRHIFAVFDACFSQDTVRGIRSAAMRSRGSGRDRQTLLKKYPLPLKQLSAGMMLIDDEAPASLSISEKSQSSPNSPYTHTIYLSACGRNEPAEDMPAGHHTVDGIPHGVLTNSLIKALDFNQKDADGNGNGTLSYGELFQYVRMDICQSQYEQTPQLLLPRNHVENHPGLLNEKVFNLPIPVPNNPVITPPIVDGNLRIFVESGTNEIIRNLKQIKGIQLVKSDPDLIITKTVIQNKAIWQLGLPNGRIVKEYPLAETDRLTERINREMLLKPLNHIPFKNNPFNLYADLIASGPVLTVGEKIGMKWQTERQAYILMLHMDADGKLTVLYPWIPEELPPQTGGDMKFIDVFGQVTDSGIGQERIIVFAFQEKPTGLGKFMNQNFLPSSSKSSKYQTLLKLIDEGDQKGMAKTTIYFQTCSQKDLQTTFN